MDKRILREIAKRWCKGILLANDLTDEETAELLSEEEMSFIQEESYRIANKITNLETPTSLNELIKEYYSFDDES